MFEVTTPYEIYFEISRFTEISAIFCLYLGISQTPGNEANQRILGNLIVNRCTENLKYSRIENTSVRYRKTLDKFISPKNKSEKAKQVRRLMLPLYARVMKIINPPHKYIFGPINRLDYHMSMDIIYNNSTFQDAFLIGDRGIIELLINEALRIKVYFYVYMKMFKAAASYEPVNENILFVVNKIQRSNLIDRTGWLNILAYCYRKCDDVSILQGLCEKVSCITPKEKQDFYIEAARSGRLHVLESLGTSEIKPKTLDSMMGRAARKGHLHIVRYLEKLLEDLIEKKVSRDEIILMAIHTACLYGKLEVLTYLHEQYNLPRGGFEIIDSDFLMVVGKGHTSCVQYMLEHQDQNYRPDDKAEWFDEILDSVSFKHIGLGMILLLRQYFPVGVSQLEHLLRVSVRENKPEIYCYCRDQLGLEAMSILLKEVFEVIVESDSLDMLIYVKMDFSARFSDFQEKVWTEIEQNILQDTLIKPSYCIAEYYLAEVLTRDQKKDRLRRYLENITLRKPLSDKLLDLVYDHMENIKEELDRNRNIDQKIIKRFRRRIEYRESLCGAEEGSSDSDSEEYLPIISSTAPSKGERASSPESQDEEVAEKATKRSSDFSDDEVAGNATKRSTGNYFDSDDE